MFNYVLRVRGSSVSRHLAWSAILWGNRANVWDRTCKTSENIKRRNMRCPTKKEWNTMKRIYSGYDNSPFGASKCEVDYECGKIGHRAANVHPHLLHKTNNAIKAYNATSIGVQTVIRSVNMRPRYHLLCNSDIPRRDRWDAHNWKSRKRPLFSNVLKSMLKKFTRRLFNNLLF